VQDVSSIVQGNAQPRSKTSLSQNVNDAVIIENTRLLGEIKSLESKFNQSCKQRLTTQRIIEENDKTIKALSESTSKMRQRLASVLAGKINIIYSELLTLIKENYSKNNFLD